MVLVQDRAVMLPSERLLREILHQGRFPLRLVGLERTGQSDSL